MAAILLRSSCSFIVFVLRATEWLHVPDEAFDAPLRTIAVEKDGTRYSFPVNDGRPARGCCRGERRHDGLQIVVGGHRGVRQPVGGDEGAHIRFQIRLPALAWQRGKSARAPCGGGKALENHVPASPVWNGRRIGESDARSSEQFRECVDRIGERLRRERDRRPRDRARVHTRENVRLVVEPYRSAADRTPLGACQIDPQHRADHPALLVAPPRSHPARRSHVRGSTTRGGSTPVQALSCSAADEYGSTCSRAMHAPQLAAWWK